MISVVIPVYNRTFELTRALKSVLAQTVQDFEVLVVDDCSEDDIQKVINELSDERIKYYRLPKKGNGSVARNVGIKEAKGEYIAMLDSDDEWTSNHLESRLFHLQEKEVDGVFGSAIIDNGKNKKRIPSRAYFKNEKIGDYLLGDGFAPTPSHFYKAKCAKDILWDESLRRSQDLDFSIRFAEKYSFEPVPDFTCIVHWKQGETREEHLDSNIKFIQKHRDKISIPTYHKYHRDIYLKIYSRTDIDDQKKKYFLTKSAENIAFCSLNDFMSSYGVGRSKIGKALLRIIYTFRVLFSK